MLGDRMMARVARLAALACAAAATATTPTSVSPAAAYNATAVRGIVYGQGLIYAETPQQRVVNLTLDAWVPARLPGGQAVPSSPRPHSLPSCSSTASASPGRSIEYSNKTF